MSLSPLTLAALWPLSGLIASAVAATDGPLCADDVVGLVVTGTLWGPVWAVIVGVGVATTRSERT